MIRNILFILLFVTSSLALASYDYDEEKEMAQMDYNVIFSKMSRKELIMSPLCKRYNEVVDILKVGEKVECVRIRDASSKKELSIEDIERELNFVMQIANDMN